MNSSKTNRIFRMAIGRRTAVAQYLAEVDALSFSAPTIDYNRKEVEAFREANIGLQILLGPKSPDRVDLACMTIAQLQSIFYHLDRARVALMFIDPPEDILGERIANNQRALMKNVANAIDRLYSDFANVAMRGEM